jgi:hypothetical protein
MSDIVQLSCRVTIDDKLLHLFTYVVERATLLFSDYKTPAFSSLTSTRTVWILTKNFFIVKRSSVYNYFKTGDKFDVLLNSYSIWCSKYLNVNFSHC